MEERLADFADRLLAGEKMGQADVFEENNELKGLQETVRIMTRAFPTGQPDAGIRNRIRGKLTVEWNAIRFGVRNQPVKWQSSAKKRQVFVAWSTLIVVAIILIGIFIAPLIGLAQPGAAQFQTGTIVMVVVILGIIGLLLWWLGNKS